MLFRGRFAKKLPNDIQRAAVMKLRYLDAADELRDLRSPPANRLEALSGDRKGQHSIRINDQWRICFRWKGGRCPRRGDRGLPQIGDTGR